MKWDSIIEANYIDTKRGSAMISGKELIKAGALESCINPILLYMIGDFELIGE